MQTPPSVRNPALGEAPAMSDSPPRASGSACGSNIGSPSQAWGQQGLLDGGDAGSTADSISAPSRPAGTSSPWQFHLNAKAANRVRSGERSGGFSSTPFLGQRYAAPRALSSGRTITQPGARASHESALLSAVRRQIETFEEKVGSQISSLRDQQQGDRLREAAFARLEEKMNTAEGMQPRLDRRLAELTGNFKGLSDEMQSQIRRVDLMDERLWEWRRQFEEEFRQKHTELETHIQKVPSSIRVMATTMDESQKRLASRLHRLEADAGERNALHDETRETLNLVCTKFEALESQRLEDHTSLIEATKASLANSLPMHGGLLGKDEDSALVSMLEQRLDDLVDKVERMFQDTHDIHARLAAQEEQQKTMRTLFDTTDGHIRSLKEVVEGGNWDAKIEQLRQALQEEGKRKLEHLERLELLSKRVEYHEQAQEELRTCHRMQMRGQDGEDGGLASATLQECAQRLEQAEANLELFNVELEAVRADSGLGSRVSELVLQLKEVGPKVMEHDRFIKEMRVEDHHRGEGFATERLKLLEEEMAQLSDKVAQGCNTMPTEESHTLPKDNVTSERMAQLEDRVSGLGEKLAQVQVPPGQARTPEIHSELGTLRSEVDAWRHSTDGNEATNEEEIAHLGKLSDVVASLREEVKQAMFSSSSRDLHPSVVADLESLKQDLGTLKARPQEMHPTVVADLETLKQDLGALKAQPRDAHHAVVTDLEALKQDLAALKAQPHDMHTTAVADLEALKQDLSALKARPHDMHPAVVEDLETLKQDVGSLKARPQVSSQDLAPHLDSLKQELCSFAEALSEQAVGAVKADVVNKQALQDTVELLRREISEGHAEGQRGASEMLKSVTEDLQRRSEHSASGHDVAGIMNDVRGLRDQMAALQDRTNNLPDASLKRETDLELTRLSETTEANKQIATSISGEIEGLRRDLDTLRDSSHQALKKELDEVRALAEASSMETRSTELLKEELQRIMSVSSISKDAAASAVSDVQDLREDLASVKAKMEAGSIEPVVSVEFKGSVEFLKQEIQRIMDLSLSSKDVAMNAMSDLQGLRDDLTNIKATVEAGSAEPLKQELQRLMDSSSSSRDVATAAASELQGLREDLAGIQAKVQAFEGERTRMVVGNLQQEALREELRQEIEACRSASEAAWHEHIRPVSEELKRLTDLSHDTQRAVSGALGELGDLGRQLAEAQAGRCDAAAVQPAVTEALEALRRELTLVKTQSEQAAREQGQVMVELKRSAEASQEQGGLKEELRSVAEAAHSGQQTAASALSEVEGLRQHLLVLADGGGDPESLRQVKGLKVEVEDAKRRANEVTMQIEAVKQQAMEAHSVSTVDMQRLKADLQSLQVRLASAPALTGGEMNELAAELAEEEEAEGRAHSQIELRIEEVCRRLTEVDQAIAASAAAAPQAGSGIPASFADKFEAVVSQVEQLQRIEHRIEAKFAQFTDEMEAKTAHHVHHMTG